MPFEHYIYAGTRPLRCGYTTGSCAALAAKAATQMLLSGKEVTEVSIMTPKGLPVDVSVLDVSLASDAVSCAVRKDGGDDIDATDGALIYATVRKTLRRATTLQGTEEPQAISRVQDAPLEPAARVSVDGGEGVGRITRAGLDQPVGAAAINSVPRRMIAEAVTEACDEAAYDGDIDVIISVADGKAIASRTFNPRLGIEGGISILGSTGIVEPQSVQAIVDTIAAEIRVAAAAGARRLVLTPGSYGERFLQTFPLPTGIPQVTISNHLGEALDRCAVEGFQEVLIASHIGKLVKVAGGIMDTHSRIADCRMEIFSAHAAICGASQGTVRELMSAPTTDACLDILRSCGPATDGTPLIEAVLASLSHAIQQRLDIRAAGAFEVGAVCYTNDDGLLFSTSGADGMLRRWRTS